MVFSLHKKIKNGQRIFFLLSYLHTYKNIRYLKKRKIALGKKKYI